MQKISFLGLVLSAILMNGCVQSTTEEQKAATTNSQQGVTNQTITTPDKAATIPDLAFLYQYVGRYMNGVGENGVRIGTPTDGATVESTGVDALAWQIGQAATVESYGDPVFSLLDNGSWSMTAWTGKEDPRGSNNLLYHESSCPVVNDDAVIAIAPSSAAGCQRASALSIGKSSQIFSADGGNYLFHSINASIYLAHMSDAEQSAMDLESMCVLDQSVAELADLDYGESTRIIDGRAAGLLLSDTAIARRSDGTWVLFVKGISSSNTCSSQGSLCELCTRVIYRSTSTDLIHWSELEQVVAEASVPEAVTTVDGEVWLYWQDFSNACEAQDLKLAAIAPISGASESADSFTLSEPVAVRFPDEAFQSDATIHFATNANPVALATEEDKAALAKCVSAK